MSKTKSLHHIVFATKCRKRLIPDVHKRDLYAYIYGILKQKRCFVHRINGMSDHIHILLDLHPSVALADVVKEIKRSSSVWMRQKEEFPFFEGWNDGYYAVSISIEGLEPCLEYIRNQEQHHRGADFVSEMETMAKSNGLDWFPEDWE